MKYLLMILLLPSFAQAKCHVTSDLDQQGNMLIQCTKGFTPPSRLHDAPLDDTGKVLKFGGFLSPSIVQVQDLFNPIKSLSKEEVCSPEVLPIEELQDHDSDPGTPDIMVEVSPGVDACEVQMSDISFCPAGDAKYNGHRLAPVPMPVDDSLDNYANTTWCVHTSYPMIDKTVYVFDQAKKDAAIAAADAAKQAADAQELAMKPYIDREKRMACGRMVITGIFLSNEAKNLSLGQKRSQKNDYRDAMEFLLLGALEEARAEVAAANPDGTVVTADDKTNVMAAIDDCIALNP